MEISLIILISYLLGSIPFGFLLTKIILKKDIREIGITAFKISKIKVL
jgi:glycerol-3-phosphate acyltransferase PlsY